MKILLTNPCISFPVVGALLVAASAVTACSSTSGSGGAGGGTTTTTSSSSGTTTTSTGSTTGTGGAATTTTTTGTGGASGTGGSAEVTYTADAEPIYASHCAPCHTTGMSGGVDFASVYADTQKVQSTANALADCPTATVPNVGACTLVRIKLGHMPEGAGCTGNPTTDTGKAACLTAAEQATLEAWITGGEKQ